MFECENLSLTEIASKIHHFSISAAHTSPSLRVNKFSPFYFDTCAVGTNIVFELEPHAQLCAILSL